jgi:hypothetical protein
MTFDPANMDAAKMTASDWIAVIALIISSGALALEIRRWFESQPRLHLSVMGDAITFPDDDGKPKLVLSVINRGGVPTMLTHMVAFTYRSHWARLRGKTDITGLVNSDRIPAELGVNKTWLGTMYYDENTTAARLKGLLYVGVIASHKSGEVLIRVPLKREVPGEKIASPDARS